MSRKADTENKPVEAPPPNWYEVLKMKNPFQIDEDPNSKEAGQHVLAILTHPMFLAQQLGVTVELTYDKPHFDTHGGDVPMADKEAYAIVVSGAPRPVFVSELVNYFNGQNPERLRITLNELGIGVLGPNPLPCLVSYSSNYVKDPLATEPGPVPKWARVREQEILAAQQKPKGPAPTHAEIRDAAIKAQEVADSNVKH